MAETAALDTLARALRELHRTLMERARSDYEREHRTIVNPGELLRLLTTDDAFAWLRELSELMADLDIVRDAKAEVLGGASDIIRPALEHILGTPDAPPASRPFAARYWPYVHDDPHVAIAHGAVKQALNAWPRPEQHESGSAAERRRELSVKARALGRGRQA
jgi:hypothetical protein